MAQSTGSRSRTAVIAGATGNVGGAAATELARRGFRVVMLGRSRKKLEQRAQVTEARLREENPAFSGQLIPLEVDLTDLNSLRRAADTLTKRFSCIDALILSAVTIAQGGPTILPDGNELMFSTNVLGQFRLAELLRPSIEAVHGFVVHVVAPFQRDLDWDDLQSKRNHRTMEAYERSKTCHRIIAGEMAHRHGDKLISIAFDPGFVIDRNDPDLRKRWPSGLTGLLWRLYAAIAAKRPSVSGEALADLLTRPSNGNTMNGAYFELATRRAKPDPSMNDREHGPRLWAYLENLAFPDVVDSGHA